MYPDSEHLSNPSAEQSIETKAIQTYTERKIYSRSHPSIPKLPVISLILGLVLFIIALTFDTTSGSSTNIWILLGQQVVCFSVLRPSIVSRAHMARMFPERVRLRPISSNGGITSLSFWAYSAQLC